MTNTNFSDLGLADPIHRALRARNHTTPTPIQSRAIPELLAGRDILGIAQTGTGKTGAFTLPILHQLSQKHGSGRKNATKSPGALILAPTRELAIQIGEEFHAYGKHLHLRPPVIFGGVSQKPQVGALARGADIVVDVSSYATEPVTDALDGIAVRLDVAPRPHPVSGGPA